jgi:Lon protease-like protein
MYTEKNQNRMNEYGCLLEIKDYQFTRDGRAVISTLGKKRFRVVSSQVKDGYIVAQVEWVKDVRVESEQEKRDLQVLHDKVYDMACKWYDIIQKEKKDKIYEIYGFNELPEKEENIQLNDDGPNWHWFLLNILPIEQDYQFRFLTKTSLALRLNQLMKILTVLLTQFENEQNRPPSPPRVQTRSTSLTSLNALSEASATSLISDMDTISSGLQ